LRLAIDRVCIVQFQVKLLERLEMDNWSGEVVEEVMEESVERQSCILSSGLAASKKSLRGSWE